MKNSTSTLTKSLIFTFLLSAGFAFGTSNHSEAFSLKKFFVCTATGPIGVAYCGYTELNGSGGSENNSGPHYTYAGREKQAEQAKRELLQERKKSPYTRVSPKISHNKKKNAYTRISPMNR